MAPRRRSRRSKKAAGRRSTRRGRWLLLAGAGVLLFVAGLVVGAGSDPESDAAEDAPWWQSLGSLLDSGSEEGSEPAGSGSPEVPDEAAEAAEAAGAQTPADGAPGPAADRDPDREGASEEADAPVEAARDAPEMPPEPWKVPPAEGGATIALVIDDLGRSLEDLDRLAALGVPVTYAVLPFETLTPQVARALTERREEILLHLPMEPESGADPGPGALTKAMSDEELRTSTRQALSAVPGAVGVNNHMGSGLSSDPRAMATVLEVVAERGLFFLDSRTSSRSVGYRTAVDRGVPAAERQVFLDAEISRAAIEVQFRRLLEIARERGAAIAIGHPHPETLAVLAERVPEARAAGYRFVPVSYLLDSPSIAAR